MCSHQTITIWSQNTASETNNVYSVIVFDHSAGCDSSFTQISNRKKGSVLTQQGLSQNWERHVKLVILVILCNVISCVYWLCDTRMWAEILGIQAERTRKIINIGRKRGRGRERERVIGGDRQLGKLKKRTRQTNWERDRETSRKETERQTDRER